MIEKNYSFDRIIDRSGTQSFKWDLYEKDTLPLWVADMDFRAPQPIIDAIIERAEHGIFGYTYYPSTYYDALIKWFKRYYDWEIKKEWLIFTPGVILAINLAIQGFSNPGDKVIVQNPVYYPFYGAIKTNGRQVLLNPLKLMNGRYQMDFENLEQIIKDSRTKLLILCNPHNPVGRLWTKEELTQLGDICLNNEIMIIADEIHCDLVYPGYKYTPFASISSEFAQNSITCNSPSKTCNVPSLKVANVIIPNSELRSDFNKIRQSHHITEPNCFASTALETAYNECEDWLNDLILYIKENLEYLKNFIKENFSEVKVIEPEGTYLVWLDFRELGFDRKELSKILFDKAKVALWEGYLFGKGGKGFERINIACPRSILKEGLNRIATAIKNSK